MKRFLFFLLLPLLAYGQVVIDYNRTVPIYVSAVALESKANDTTKAFDISEASDLAVFGYGSDSLAVAVWYRLSSSVTKRTTAWTILNDTVTVSDAAAGEGAIIGTLAQATLRGYDVIQFYVDYVNPSGESGVFRTILYMHALKRAGGRTSDTRGRDATFNLYKPVVDMHSWLSTTATDTIPQPSTDATAIWYPIVGGTDLYFDGRTNDSIRATVYYQLYNRTAQATGSWTLLDSIVTVDDLGSATYDSTASMASLALSTILGYEGIRFYVDFDATTGGTASAGDGTANRFRLYQYFLRRE